MIDNPSPLVPPLVAAAEAVQPSPEVPPPSEVTLPAPTAEQAQAADRVFSAATQPNHLATLLGVATSFMLLRDLAVDTFDTSGEDDEAEEEPVKDKDADSAD